MHESFNVWVKKIIPYRFGYWGGVQYVEHYNLIQEGKNVSAYYQKKNVRPIFVLRHYLYSLSIQNLVQHIFIYIYCTDFFCCGTAASTVSDFNEL